MKTSSSDRIEDRLEDRLAVRFEPSRLRGRGKRLRGWMREASVRLGRILGMVGMAALWMLGVSPLESTARSPVRVSGGIWVGNGWGGRSGVCVTGPGYWGPRWGGVPVWNPGYFVYGGASDFDAAFSGYAAPYTPPAGSIWVPVPGGWQVRPPSPGPGFTPPAYTPLERSLERSRERSLEKSPPRPEQKPKPLPSGPSQTSSDDRNPKVGGTLGYPSGPTPTGHPRTFRVQRTLKELGYYEAAIDGQLGPATQTAIRTFQIDRGLPVTGKIDSSLEKELGLPVEL